MRAGSTWNLARVAVFGNSAFNCELDVGELNDVLGSSSQYDFKFGRRVDRVRAKMGH